MVVSDRHVILKNNLAAAIIQFSFWGAARRSRTDPIPVRIAIIH
jgi:hypothetical protein